ncbi:transglycosylase domain-containing protein [Radiobacillus sp. PE A8.2]|uniref:transglycosylase domain-containing protein n=1 Tax=Radiobacillus sp. PE A8.2 TaxID=3380349 RepID=UPI00388F4832
MANERQSRIARRNQQKTEKKMKKPIWKKILLITGIVCLAIAVGVGGLFTYYIATAPDIQTELLSDPSSTKIRDMNGEVFADLGGAEKRTKISYNEIPQLLEDAVLATEDVRFREHIGIDFRRIGGAVIANFRDGYGAQGASTITQQVVKLSFLTKDKKLKRKVQEQWMAIRLDSQYSKDEILEMYLNKIFYGSNAYGVAKAAEVYFGKTNLDELTLPEAALLAGLPQLPSAYNPFINPERAQERMNTVLNLMVLHEKISEEEAAAAREVSVESMLVAKRPDSDPYEAFIQQVAAEVEEKTGMDIYKDGLDIYTTLDTSAQEHVEFLLSNSEDNPIQYPDEEFQAGLTVLDTNTGAIRAIGGGRNRENGGWNYAIQGDGRQPGSTFKPIVDYGPAIEYLNWSTYQQLNDDGPYPIGGTNSVIENYNDRFQGWMTMRYALKESINVPAVKTFEEVGRQNAQEFAENLGIDFYEDSIALTDAIGGSSTGVTPLEMAGAYRAFGNEGIYNEPYAVTKIVFNDNRSEEFQNNPKAVMSDFTAYMVTDMLKSVVTNGSGTVANVSGLPIAGKTGTTDDRKDIWFSGYTTNYTIAIWTGYGEPAPISNEGTNIARTLFKETISQLSEEIDTPDFERPNSVVEVTVEKGSDPAKLPSEYTPDSEKITELFVRGTEPTGTSEKYDQLDPVQQLAAAYDLETNTITVDWQYEDTDKPISFDISAGTDPNALTKLQTIKEKTIEISNVDMGTTYTIEVVVISDENPATVSEPVRVQIQIPEEQPEEEEEPVEDPNDGEGDDDNGNDDGNPGQGDGGNNPGQNPGNDNGGNNDEPENPDDEEGSGDDSGESGTVPPPTGEGPSENAEPPAA